MLRVSRFVLLTISLGVMAIAGCVSTQIQTDWQDTEFRGTFKKVLVICLVKEPIVRNTLESDMAAQFTNRGVKAVPSNTVFASLKDVDKEMVKRKVREIGADGVFLIRPVGLETNEYSASDAWGAYYEMPEQPLTAETHKVQISLYETAKGKVVWQALSDTLIGGAWTDTLKEFARVMGAKLIERKLI